MIVLVVEFLQLFFSFMPFAEFLNMFTRLHQVLIQHRSQLLYIDFGTMKIAPENYLAN